MSHLSFPNYPIKAYVVDLFFLIVFLVKIRTAETSSEEKRRDISVQ